MFRPAEPTCREYFRKLKKIKTPGRADFKTAAGRRAAAGEEQNRQLTLEVAEISRGARQLQSQISQLGHHQ